MGTTDSYVFKDNHLEVKPPKRTKKMTATRFGAVLGLNRWSSPFSVWCEMTKTYEEPFKDSIYTIAGKVIEPKIIDYLKNQYFLDIKDPTEVYGKDYFKRTYGDFYPDNKIFGGMWDVKGDDLIVEIKTTKRAEDWTEDTPPYYKLQAALYAYLSGIDKVYMVCSFLKEADYDNPEAFVPTIENTIVRPFKMSEAYPNFEEDYIKPATEFWKKHVLTGVSPDFDEKRDKDILKELRKNVVTGDDDLHNHLQAIEKLLPQKEILSEQLKALENELKPHLAAVKSFEETQFGESDKQVEVKGTKYMFTLTKSVTQKVDSEALKADNLFEKYSTEAISYKFTNKKLEDEKGE